VVTEEADLAVAEEDAAAEADEAISISAAINDEEEWKIETSAKDKTINEETSRLELILI
jgi:hypothetical protein